MPATASNTEVVLITKDSLGTDWHGKTVPMLWRTWAAASTHPILLRMGPAELLLSRSLVRSLHLMDAVCTEHTTTLAQHYLHSKHHNTSTNTQRAAVITHAHNEPVSHETTLANHMLPT
jgi:hypothetical protein